MFKLLLQRNIFLSKNKFINVGKLDNTNQKVNELRNHLTVRWYRENLELGNSYNVTIF